MMKGIVMIPPFVLIPSLSWIGLASVSFGGFSIVESDWWVDQTL